MTSPEFKQKLRELWESRAFRFATGAFVAGVAIWLFTVPFGSSNSLMPPMPSMPPLAGPSSPSQSTPSASTPQPQQQAAPRITGTAPHTNVDADFDTPELPDWDY